VSGRQHGGKLWLRCKEITERDGRRKSRGIGEVSQLHDLCADRKRIREML